ncbi:hypothetical protein [Streptomyces sp. NPDC024089]|uniref:hypothetical protein n=1 Tax=Streptomyces sp. NPDC024089 TaxID=3154328 RepID=UPI0033CCF155
MNRAFLRTPLATGVVAVAEILGGAGSAPAHDRDDEHRPGGETSVCGTFVGAGNGCLHAPWEGMYPGRGFHHGLNPLQPLAATRYRQGLTAVAAVMIALYRRP